MNDYERPSREHANYNSRLKYARSVWQNQDLFLRKIMVG
jgi:hypothetical protein